jgi:hypothetical protein
MIQERLKTDLSIHRIRVKTQFKGYDLGAYVDDAPFTDVGSIDVEATGTLLAKIEIKATRGQTVSMSNRQGEEAGNDPSRFWLCVVPLDSDEDVDGLTAERVEAVARFVPGIGSRLAPAREGIQEAVESADEKRFRPRTCGRNSLRHSRGPMERGDAAQRLRRGAGETSASETLDGDGGTGHSDASGDVAR